MYYVTKNKPSMYPQALSCQTVVRYDLENIFSKTCTRTSADVLVTDPVLCRKQGLCNVYVNVDYRYCYFVEDLDWYS